MHKSIKNYAKIRFSLVLNCEEYMFKKVFFVFVALFLIGLSPKPADAQSCDSVVLDLVCPNGHVLKGIDSNGNKICVADRFGGIYVTNNSSCRHVNVYTGACSCPSGYSAQLSFDFVGTHHYEGQNVYGYYCTKN